MLTLLQVLYPLVTAATRREQGKHSGCPITLDSDKDQMIEDVGEIEVVIEDDVKSEYELGFGEDDGEVDEVKVEDDGEDMEDLDKDEMLFSCTAPPPNPSQPTRVVDLSI